jgi:hypothetical protein
MHQHVYLYSFVVSTENKHVRLSCDLDGTYMYKLVRAPQSETHVVICKVYKKKSLYSHLLHKMSSMDRYGSHMMSLVFDLLG